jgi:peptidoglycan LD-endopeptidase LytH
MQPQPIIQVLRRYAQNFHPVVPFTPGKDSLLKMDFTQANRELSPEMIGDTPAFSVYVKQLLEKAHARYGIGGYNEHRTVYARSAHFDGKDEPRRLHLGVDIWGPAGTPVYAFMGGMVHAVAFNDNYGDYGATLILLHQLDGMAFYTLYGHIGLEDIRQLSDGQYLVRGQEIAHFGEPAENGHWPPHLHFQVIVEMGVKYGDYPGVCKFSEREAYLQNCPDPDLILQMEQYVI